MRIEAGSATDIGRVRERNEDAYLVDPPLYVVADGMGGHRGGAVASQLAVDTVEELFRAGTGTLTDQVRRANQAVFERSAEDRRVTGMGTTFTAALVEGGAVRLVHVGDSRAYLLRGGALRQLTDDHTLVNRMVKAGEITPDEAELHPHRNVLTRVLGTEPEVEVDEDSIGLLDGDRLLLCSDGLTNMVTEDQIQAILETAARPQEAADRLVRAANRAGGVDNITAVLLDVRDDDARDGSAPPGGADPGRAGSAPQRMTAAGRQRLLWWSKRVGIVVAVGLAVLFGIRAFVDSQWYVGEANGHVAVYQGIPVEVGGLHLSHVAVETDIPAHEADASGAYSGTLADGLTASSRDDAQEIVDGIRTALQEARAAGGAGAP